MSTWLYLECQSHTPPLSSASEVGQHLYDLPTIRGYFAERQHLAEVDADDLPDYWRRTAARFFHDHPHCRVGIRDEYGEEHPIEEPAPDRLRGHPAIPVPPTVPERTAARFTGPTITPEEN